MNEGDTGVAGEGPAPLGTLCCRLRGRISGPGGKNSPTTPLSPPRTSRMAPESRQETEEAEEEALPSRLDREPVSGHLGPPADTPTGPVAPECPQYTKPGSTQVVFSANLQLAPESLDPRTLQRLWGQRELEIQALRWAIQNHWDARHCHILQEVAGLPSDRSLCRQHKFLQNQVQKLTLELKEQKEQAQLERAHLEERLQQTMNTLQQLEVELQAYQKSCLLQLAHSSWVGRMLRSSTGSVEVVTAETLVDSSDLSENEQARTAGKGFRLEDVDWNSIAHRYPNLFTNMESSLDQKHSRPPLPPQLSPASSPEEWGSELRKRRVEQRLKSVEWSSLPLEGTSSSGGSYSNSSSCQLARRYRKQKLTGHPPRAPHRASEQIVAQARSFSGDDQAEREGGGHVSPGSSHPSCPGSDPGCCSSPIWTLKALQAGSRLADVPSGRSIGGSPSRTGLQKTHGDLPGKTVALVPESSSGPDPGHPGHCWSATGCCLKIVAVSRRERFVRILNQSLEETADLGGFTLQQLVRDFPVGIYRFPAGTLLAPRHHVTVWGEGPPGTKKQPPSSLGDEPVHFHSGRSCVTRLLNPKGEVLSEYQAPHCVTPLSRVFADNTDLSIDRFPLSEAGRGADPDDQRRRPQPPRKGRVREDRAGRWRPRTRLLLPLLSVCKLFRAREVLARPERTETHTPELLPALPEAGLGLEVGQARKEHKVRVCRKSVDRSCPMVALSVQSTAESRFGFRFLPCPPITADGCGRV
ncbi:lamin tail domain-containing protein 2 [Diceros bicornis minor]|uniref:lamin tail domain-containing protein 2 n=1 Tax=Diceros bicornis minor TaxID=77932 RepID=UPI0026EBE323|nr:lamin tail domain-containing protein 2 [Diceros bicornis minor]